MVEDSTGTVQNDQLQQYLCTPEGPISSKDESSILKEGHLNSSHLPRNRGTGQSNSLKLQPSNAQSYSAFSALTILLEEISDLPIFWNGQGLVPMMKWGPFLKSPPPYTTVEDFLSTYVAGHYLQKCTMSLQVSRTKYINNLKMVDPFSKILDHQSKEGSPVVTLMLSHSNEEISDSGYAKYILYIREGANNKILWNTGKLSNKLVAKLTQADMGLTVGSCLKNYVAKGYLSQDCHVDLVQECPDSSLNPNKEKLSAVALSDLVQTLFMGNTATIVVRTSTTGESNSPAKKDSSTSTNIPIFLSSTTSSHWVAGRTWGDIRDEVSVLVTSVEETMRDRILTTEVYASILEKKVTLETAMRRRSRVVDEVWRCFHALQRAHMDLQQENTVRAPQETSATSFETPRNSSVSVFHGVLRPNRAGVEGDAPQQLVALDASAMELFSETLMRCGVELELYDEGDRQMSRFITVGIGVAAFVVICTIVYYF